MSDDGKKRRSRKGSGGKGPKGPGEKAAAQEEAPAPVEERPEVEAITASMLARICALHFDDTPTRISLPGGPGRASVRVHFPARTVIATYRTDAKRREAERQVLEALAAAGAATPDYLGERNGIVFQADAGTARLSEALPALSGRERDALVIRVLRSLRQTHALAAEADLAAHLRPIAVNARWTTGFLSGPEMLSEALGLPAPDFDRKGVAEAVEGRRRAFVKWGARPGSAAVQADGSVIWHGWGLAGLRNGDEDFCALFGDEHWPISARRSSELFVAAGGDPRARPFLACFTTLHIVQRLILIHRKVTKEGWGAPGVARSLDRIGDEPEDVVRLADHGAAWARSDPRTAPLAAWFRAVGAQDGDKDRLAHWPA